MNMITVNHDAGPTPDRAPPRSSGSEHRAKKRGRSGLGTALTYVVAWACLFLGAALLTSSRWIYERFGLISVPQFLTHVPKGGGLDAVPSEFVWSFVVEVVLFSLAISFSTLALVVGLRKILKRRSGRNLALISPLLVMVLSSFALLTVGGTSFASGIGLRDYLESQGKDIEMADYYERPVVLTPPPGDKNLVLIYLESMDDAFGNPDLIGENALTSLQQATEGWQSIDGFSHYPSGGWTMPGIVGTQCGLPKYPPESETSFYGNAVCLGDILQDAGYTNVWMGGADESFEDKGLFLKSHGYDQILMRSHWEAQGEDVSTREVWGLSDKRLFELAEEEVLKLRDAGQPFNLSLLTVDNHDPIYQWDYCPTTSEDITISTVRCQSTIVSEFLTFLKDNGFMENTVVVVMADHSMHAKFHEVSSYMDKLSPEERRSVPLFNRITSPDEFQIEREQDNQLHMFPTILELLGGEVRNGRAGLGVSFLQPESAVAGERTIVGKSVDEIQAILETSIPKDALVSD